MAAPEKQDVLDQAERFVCPHRVRTLGALGVDLVIGRREGYRLWDLEGRALLDFHLNGGVFNASRAWQSRARRRCGLYQAALNSKTARRASTWVVKRCRSS